MKMYFERIYSPGFKFAILVIYVSILIKYSGPESRAFVVKKCYIFIGPIVFT